MRAWRAPWRRRRRRATTARCACCRTACAAWPPTWGLELLADGLGAAEALVDGDTGKLVPDAEMPLLDTLGRLCGVLEKSMRAIRDLPAAAPGQALHAGQPAVASAAAMAAATAIDAAAAPAFDLARAADAGRQLRAALGRGALDDAAADAMAAALAGHPLAERVARVQGALSDFDFDLAARLLDAVLEAVDPLIAPLNEENDPMNAVAKTAVNKPLILAVDDEASNLQLLRQILQDHYRLCFAKDGPRALELTREERPDLILLDVMMPGMSGYEVCARLKADPATASIPIIFVTALADTDDELEGFEAGAVDYITKPVSQPIVRARVRNHLSLVRMDELRASRLEIVQRLGPCLRIQGQRDRPARDPDEPFRARARPGRRHERGAGRRTCCTRRRCTTSARSASPTASCKKPGPLDPDEWKDHAEPRHDRRRDHRAA